MRDVVSENEPVIWLVSLVTDACKVLVDNGDNVELTPFVRIVEENPLIAEEVSLIDVIILENSLLLTVNKDDPLTLALDKDDSIEVTGLLVSDTLLCEVKIEEPVASLTELLNPVPVNDD
jgi:hypothetical protein